MVAINESRCTGCGECALACPYGAIGYNAEQHHAVKCDLCAERRGRDLGPACASVCPTRAISFDNRAALLQQAEQQNRAVLDTDHFLQQPATIYLKRLRDDTARTAPQPTRSTPALMRDHQPRRSLPAKRTRLLSPRRQKCQCRYRGTHRPGRLQHLLQRLPGQISPARQRGSQHLRQRRRPGIPGTGLPQIANDAADV